MQACQRVMSPRQLRRLSPIVLGLWLMVLVVTSFQPCAVAAETLAELPQVAKTAHQDGPEKHCSNASDQHGKDSCCDHNHYTHCNQPDVVKHDPLVKLDFQTHASFLPVSAIFLSRVNYETRQVISIYHPPADLLRHLSVTRLLI